MQLEEEEKTFIFHPLFASENFAEDKDGSPLGSIIGGEHLCILAEDR